MKRALLHVALLICSAYAVTSACKDGTLDVIKGTRCRRYAECQNGSWHLKECKIGQLFDPNTLRCASVREVRRCADGLKCSEGRTYFHLGNNNLYYRCINGRISLQVCGVGQIFDHDLQNCRPDQTFQHMGLHRDKRDAVEEERRTTEQPTTPQPTDPPTTEQPTTPQPTYSPTTPQPTVPPTTEPPTTPNPTDPLTTEQLTTPQPTVPPTTEEPPQPTDAPTTPKPTVPPTTEPPTSPNPTDPPTTEQPTTPQPTDPPTTEQPSTSQSTVPPTTEPPTTPNPTDSPTTEQPPTAQPTNPPTTEQPPTPQPTNPTTTEQPPTPQPTNPPTTEQPPTPQPTNPSTTPLPTDSPTESPLPDSTTPEAETTILTSTVAPCKEGEKVGIVDPECKSYRECKNGVWVKDACGWLRKFDVIKKECEYTMWNTVTCAK